MSNPYQGDPDVCPEDIDVPTDDDDFSAASVGVPLEQLADRTAALVPKIFVFDSVPDLDNDREWTTRPAGAVLYNFQGIGGGGDGGNASGGTGGGGGSSGEYFNVTLPASLVPSGTLYVRQGSHNNPSFVYDQLGWEIGGRGGVDGSNGGAGAAAATGRMSAGGDGGAAGGPFSATGGAYGPAGGSGGTTVTNQSGFSGNGYGAGGGGGGQTGDQGAGGAGGFGATPAGTQSGSTTGNTGTRGVVIITVWVEPHA